jgi:hypothetical protein
MRSGGDLLMDWISFGDKLPQVGQRIDIKFDDGKEFGDYGTLRTITDIKDLPDGSACFVGEAINGKAWSMCSDKYIGSIVRDSYYWRAVQS